MKTIIAALLVLLAGCKSAPSKSYFLYADNNLVMCIEWARVGDRIEGNWMIDGLADGKVKTRQAPFTAEKEGETFRLRGKDSAPLPDSSTRFVTVTLKGDTLTLYGSLKFQRATYAECFEASRKLAERAIRAKATP